MSVEGESLISFETDLAAIALQTLRFHRFELQNSNCYPYWQNEMEKGHCKYFSIAATF